MSADHLRHLAEGGHHERLFGDDLFGRASEAIATFMGTPTFLIAQTVVTMIWIVVNLVLLTRPFDPYPFILLNLAYSIQAGFSGPFVLCAQVRQSRRDKAVAEADAKHREELALTTHTMLTDLKAALTKGTNREPGQ